MIILKKNFKEKPFISKKNNYFFILSLFLLFIQKSFSNENNNNNNNNFLKDYSLYNKYESQKLYNCSNRLFFSFNEFKNFIKIIDKKNNNFIKYKTLLFLIYQKGSLNKEDFFRILKNPKERRKYLIDFYKDNILKNKFEILDLANSLFKNKVINFFDSSNNSINLKAKSLFTLYFISQNIEIIKYLRDTKTTEEKKLENYLRLEFIKNKNDYDAIFEKYIYTNNKILLLNNQLNGNSSFNNKKLSNLQLLRI